MRENVMCNIQYYYLNITSTQKYHKAFLPFFLMVRHIYTVLWATTALQMMWFSWCCSLALQPSAKWTHLQIEGNDSLLENCALFPHWEGINVCFMVLWMSHRKVNWWGHNKRHLYPNVNPYQCSSIAWSCLNLELWHLGGLWGIPVDSPSRWQLPGHLALEEDLVWESTRPPSRNWKTLMYKRVCGIPCLYLMCFHIKRWE